MFCCCCFSVLFLSVFVFSVFLWFLSYFCFVVFIYLFFCHLFCFYFFSFLFCFSLLFYGFVLFIYFLFVLFAFVLLFIKRCWSCLVVHRQMLELLQQLQLWGDLKSGGADPLWASQVLVPVTKMAVSACFAQVFLTFSLCLIWTWCSQNTLNWQYYCAQPPPTPINSIIPSITDVLYKVDLIVCCLKLLDFIDFDILFVLSTFYLMSPKNKKTIFILQTLLFINRECKHNR